MANSLQAKKRDRQAKKRRLRNGTLRSMIRTYIKKTQAYIKASDVQGSQSSFSATARLLDKMVSKGIFHKNKVARIKSNLNKHIKALCLKEKI